MELEVCNTNDDNDEDDFETDALVLPQGRIVLLIEVLILILK